MLMLLPVLSLPVLLLSGGVTHYPRVIRPRLVNVRLGFEVEDVDERAVGEMGVMSWPGLEKRTSDFSQSATANELLMVYVKDGSGSIIDATSDETTQVRAGQMVMISDGQVGWSGISEGGVTLLTTVTPLDDVDIDLVEPPAVAGSDDSADKDLSVLELALVLAGGLLAGKLLSFGLVTFNTPDM